MALKKASRSTCMMVRMPDSASSYPPRLQSRAHETSKRAHIVWDKVGFARCSAVPAGGQSNADEITINYHREGHLNRSSSAACWPILSGGPRRRFPLHLWDGPRGQ